MGAAPFSFWAAPTCDLLRTAASGGHYIPVKPCVDKILQGTTINWHQTCTDIKVTQTLVSGLAKNTEFLKKVSEKATEITDKCAIPVGPGSFPIKYKINLI